MTPTKAAAVPVAMNNTTLTRLVGTPAPRAATGSPPVALIQLPNAVRDRTMPAAAVTAIHHKIETLACPQAEPNSRCTSGGGLTEIFVVFVSNRARPVAPPATQKLAASDTINDGRPVRTVMIALISPTHAPAKSTMAIMSQNGTLKI